MKPETINLITNIIGVLLAVLEPVRAYLVSEPFNWVTFGICIGSAIIAWYTGKSSIYLKKEMVKKGVWKN